MKKKLIVTITILSILFLTISVYAAGQLLTRRDFTVQITREAKQQLEKMELDNSSHSPLRCNEEFCYFDMWKIISKEITVNETDRNNNTIEVTRTINETYYLGKNHEIPARNCTAFNGRKCIEYYNYTNIELEGLMEDKIVEKLEFYATVFGGRETNNSRTPRIGEGRVIINER